MERVYNFCRFLFLFLVLGTALLCTEVGKKLLSKGVSEVLSQKYERKVTITNIDFAFPDSLIVYGLQADIGLDEELKVENLSIKTPLIKLINGDIANLRMDATGIRIGGVVIEEASAQMYCNSAERCVNYRITASQNGLVEASLVGSLIQEGQRLSLIAETCLIEAGGFRASLLEPMHAKIENKKFILDPVQFILADSIIDLQGSCTPTELDATIYCLVSSFENLSWLFRDLFVTGSGTIQMDVRGAWDNPEIHGDLALEDVTVESLTSGAIFHQIYARGVIDKQQLQLVNLNALDLHGGSINMEGQLLWKPSESFPFKVNIQLDKAALLDLEEIRSDFSGQLLLTGNWREAALKGSLNVDDLSILLGTDSTPAIKHIDVIYINADEDDANSPSRIENEVRWPLSLEVDLHSRGTISITDEQLNSKWKGDLRISGTTMATKLLGDWRLDHGEYIFNGKKFKLTEGTISFLGDWQKKTQLFVVGAQQVAGIHAEVVLKGPLDDLSLAFRSTPPLSEREILSRLLFGCGSNNISPYQGSELTESINKLKNGERAAGLDLLNNIKKRFGIDRIDINRENGSIDEDNYSLQVGKYLSPGVFIGVTKGLTSETNRIGIEADLLRNMKLQAEIGDDSNGQLHLMWKHDY